MSNLPPQHSSDTNHIRSTTAASAARKQCSRKSPCKCRCECSWRCTTAKSIFQSVQSRWISKSAGGSQWRCISVNLVSIDGGSSSFFCCSCRHSATLFLPCDALHGAAHICRCNSATANSRQPRAAQRRGVARYGRQSKTAHH